MTDINTLTNKIRNDFARPNRYRITIGLPLGITNAIISPATDVLSNLLPGSIGNVIQSVSSIATDILQVFGGDLAFQEILLNCEGAQLPGITIGQSEKREYGPVIRIPNSVAYQEVPLTFYCSKDHRERMFFEMWMDLIFNRNTNDFNFYDEYKSVVVIEQLDMEGNVTFAASLEDAYPLALTPIELGYSNTDVIEKFTVSMNFRVYKPSYTAAINNLI